MKIKKIFLIIMAVLICFTVLTACEDEEKPSTSSGGGTSITSEYDFLNEMLEVNYSKITLTVENKFDEETSLTSKYVMSFSGETVNVDYTVERFNQISLDKPNTSAKYTITGQTVIENGSITSNSSENVIITPEIAEVDFEFKEEYFENAELTSLYLKADVKDVKNFTKDNIDCKDMKVYAEFLETFYQIKVSYTNENGTQVEVKYDFTL